MVLSILQIKSYKNRFTQKLPIFLAWGKFLALSILIPQKAINLSLRKRLIALLRRWLMHMVKRGQLLKKLLKQWKIYKKIMVKAYVFANLKRWLEKMFKAHANSFEIPSSKLRFHKKRVFMLPVHQF
jgi:uridine kinase